MDKEDIKEHRKNSFAQWSYSLNRIDLLIISISGGGIYVILETIKYSTDHKLNTGCFLKAIGIVFIVAIISNFISQFCSKSSCKHDLYHWDYELKNNEAEANKEDGISETYDKISDVFNITSAILMLSGLVMMIVYFSITF